MLTLLAATWLSFFTAKGEIYVKQEDISSLVAQRSTNCTTEIKDGKAVTMCPLEYYVCTKNICHGVTWNKTFDELKKVIVPDPIIPDKVGAGISSPVSKKPAEDPKQK